MNPLRVLDAVFPYIEPLDTSQRAADAQRLQDDIAAIEAADWSNGGERALDEAQRVADVETERVRTAEGKAATYLAVLAALVPIIIMLQAANWERKAGPAPDGVRLLVLALATIYVGAAGYHAFRALQVSGFQRVGEGEVATAWRTADPLPNLARGTLLASRRSRDAVNAKVTRIRVTHAHLLRAFATFIILLMLDPTFYALGFRNAPQDSAKTQPLRGVDPGPDHTGRSQQQAETGGRTVVSPATPTAAPTPLPSRQAQEVSARLSLGDASECAKRRGCDARRDERDRRGKEAATAPPFSADAPRASGQR